jgi:hypothetical protein
LRTASSTRRRTGCARPPSGSGTSTKSVARPRDFSRCRARCSLGFRASSGFLANRTWGRCLQRSSSLGLLCRRLHPRRNGGAHEVICPSESHSVRRLAAGSHRLASPPEVLNLVSLLVCSTLEQPWLIYSPQVSSHVAALCTPSSGCLGAPAGASREASFGCGSRSAVVYGLGSVLSS